MINFQGVSYTYQQHEILKNINIEIHKGEKVGIIGPSGSGKTTLLKLVDKEVIRTKGEVIVQGKALPISQAVTESFNPKMTILESLLEPLIYYRNIKKESAIKLIEAEVSKYHLKAAQLHALPHALSGGELQRFNILRTLLANPDIILCDEVTSKLDLVSEESILNLLNDYHQRNNVTLLIVTHNLEPLIQMVDRIVVIHEGVIVDDFNIEALHDSERNIYVKTMLDLLEIEK